MSGAVGGRRRRRDRRPTVGASPIYPTTPTVILMSREKILSFTKTYYDKHDVSPSIREIADGVDGVDRKSFYQYFKDKNELLVALGIQEEVIKPKAAMEAKKRAAEKGGDYLVTLNRAQSEKLIAIAYMEGKPVSMVVDEVLEDQRQVRQIMVDINGGTLDGELIEAILNPGLVYKKWNVSVFAGKPWFLLKCKKCGDPQFFGEGLDATKWLFEIMPLLTKALKVTCKDCVPKRPVYIRIPA